MGGKKSIYCVHASLSAAARSFHFCDAQNTNNNTAITPIDAVAHIIVTSEAGEMESISFVVRRGSSLLVLSDDVEFSKLFLDLVG